MRIAVIDTETTDFENAGVVEFAAVVIDAVKKKQVGEFTSLVNPGDHEMSIKALATHHIGPGMYKNAPLLSEVLRNASKELSGAELWAAHNAKFDGQFFEGQEFICTWKVARHLWPDAPGYSNQVLRYWLGLPDPKSRLPPHRALPDAQVTANLLLRILDKVSPEEAHKLSNTPVLLKTISFGKYEGKDYEFMVPRDRRYFHWVLSADFDEDVKFTVERYL